MASTEYATRYRESPGIVPQSPRRFAGDRDAIDGSLIADEPTLAWVPCAAPTEHLTASVPHWLERRRVGYWLAKRAFDLVSASIGLVIISPLMLVIVIAMVLDHTWPIVYAQTRIGRHGRPFRMLKLRTMRPDRRMHPVPVDFPDRRHFLKTDHDPRVTRIGKVLRRSSLDELPQLINVLRGDMSLVGPRPELPEMVALYEGRHCLRHLAVPGLTGWWQVNGRCSRTSEIDPRVDLEQKLADDIYYLEHQSFGLDLTILLRTVGTVFSRRGAI